MTNKVHPYSAITHSDEYVNALRAVLERPLLFEDFSRMPMPTGYSAEDLWRDFAILRRCAGTTYSVKPWFESGGGASWAFMPKSTERELNGILFLSAPGSSLNAYVNKRGRSALCLVPFIVDELVSLTHRDGMHLSREIIQALWLGQRVPANAEERVLANAVSLFHGANKFKERRFSIALIERLHEDLTEGVGELANLEPKHPFGKGLIPKELAEDPDFAEQMMIAASADVRAVGQTMNFICVAYELSAVLWDLPCFPSLNALTEFIVRRVFFVQQDMPILSYVPFSWLSGRKENHFAATFESEFKYLVSHIGSEEGLDCTLNFSGAVTTYLAGLQRIDETVSSAKEQAARMRSDFEQAEGLNWRQKDFLVILLRDPAFTVKVKSYAELYGIVRATARSDLYGLADKGYLACHEVDRAVIFGCSPNLQAAAQDAARSEERDKTE